MSQDAGVFRLLQLHLDAQPIGFPAAESGADIRVLKKVFAPDEAALALQLSYKPAPLAEIAARTGPGTSREQVKHLLDDMVSKGSIGWRERDGVDQWFLLPLIVGFFENQDGVPSPRFLAEVGPYLEAGGFVRSFITARPSQVRVVPIHESLPVEHHVAAYDQLRAIVEAAPGPFVALKCICREMKAMQAQPCKKTARLETCLGLNDVAAAVLRRGHGREVSREELLSILEQNEKDGLVLQTSNAQRIEFVCSCCGCCCGLLTLQKRLPRPVDFWTSNYQCTIEADACTGCGECPSRCQVGALTMTEQGDAAQIDLGRCIGCGVCVPACPAGALRLATKPSAGPPPEDVEALNDRIMANRSRPTVPPRA